MNFDPRLSKNRKSRRLKPSRRIAAASSQSSLLEEPPPALPLHPFLRSEEDSISVLHPDEFSPEKIFARLQEGQEVGLEKLWRWDQALRLYGALKREVEKHYGTPRSFHEDLQLRAIRHEILGRLWVSIQEGKVQIRGAPPIGWLSSTYGNRRGWLRFSDVLGLNGAWQWYLRGIRFPYLPWTLHPWYGVYFPTRWEHLELLDSWLSRWPEKEHVEAALDLGCGCGVLSLYLCKHLPRRTMIWATDLNPAAVQGFQADLQRLGLQDQVRVVQADMIPPDLQNLDLILCNPPWLPGPVRSVLEAGIYYEEGFFARLFTQVSKALRPGGTFVLLFSNFAQVSGLTAEHPILLQLRNHPELVGGIAGEVSVRPPRKRIHPWLRAVRQRERVQLWVLKRK